MTMLAKNDLDATCINTIRTLSMDAVQAANSGHPGTPMALAPVAYCLWQNFLRFDPQDPIWPNRDRFVLSAGHASMLLYSRVAACGPGRVADSHGFFDVSLLFQRVCVSDPTLPNGRAIWQGGQRPSHPLSATAKRRPDRTIAGKAAGIWNAMPCPGDG